MGAEAGIVVVMGWISRAPGFFVMTIMVLGLCFFVMTGKRWTFANYRRCQQKKREKRRKKKVQLS